MKKCGVKIIAECYVAFKMGLDSSWIPHNILLLVLLLKKENVKVDTIMRMQIVYSRRNYHWNLLRTFKCSVNKWDRSFYRDRGIAQCHITPHVFSEKSYMDSNIMCRRSLTVKFKFLDAKWQYKHLMFTCTFVLRTVAMSKVFITSNY